MLSSILSHSREYKISSHNHTEFWRYRSSHARNVTRSWQDSFISSASCWDILNIVDDYDNIGRYLNSFLAKCFTFAFFYVWKAFKFDPDCIFIKIPTDDFSMNSNWNFMWWMHNNYETFPCLLSFSRYQPCRQPDFPFARSGLWRFFRIALQDSRFAFHSSLIVTYAEVQIWRHSRTGVFSESVFRMGVEIVFVPNLHPSLEWVSRSPSFKFEYFFEKVFLKFTSRFERNSLFGGIGARLR